MKLSRRARILYDLGLTLGLHLLAMLAAQVVHYLQFSESAIIILYLLSVLLTSCLTRGYSYGIIASVLTVISINFFWTPPTYSLIIAERNSLFTFIITLLAAILTSTLTSKLIRQTQIANEKEHRLQALYQVSSALSQASGFQAVASTAAHCLAELLSCEARCILLDYRCNLGRIFIASSPQDAVKVQTRPLIELENELQGQNTIALPVHNQPICCIWLPKQARVDEKAESLRLILAQITIALQREMLSYEKEQATAEVEQERFKSNLLRAISHDLRTPLAGIAGSAEMLLEQLRDEPARQLARDIYEDVGWLTRLVENVLNLTRVQEKRLQLNIQPEAVEEVVASAIRKMARYFPERVISVQLPPDLLLVPMDGRLIEQVLLNLLDNAVKHTPAHSKISVLVWQEGEQWVWFEVADNGEGIQEVDAGHLFSLFYTQAACQSDAKRGIGLGLPICRAIVQRHGGEIIAENNQEGGASFRFCLPCKSAGG